MTLRRAGHALAALVVVVVFGLPMFRDLGASDYKGDEPIYSFAIDRILDHGDWLTPKSIPYDDVAFLEKPPLKFWIVAGSVKAGLLRADEFGYRFWDVIFGIGAFLYVLAIGGRMSGVVCGLTAVLVLFSHQPLIVEHGLRSNNMEAGLLLAYCGGIYHALAWKDAADRRGRWLHALGVALWFAFGFMIKFVAAIFLPAVIVISGVLSPRWRRRLLADWAIWIAVSGISAALILPWFIYQYTVRGRDFLHVIFGEHILVRFTAYLDPAHLEPWYYYFSEMARHFSWAHDLLLVIAGVVLLVYRATRERDDAALLMLLWFAVPLAAISAGTSKLYHYVYPFLPPLALGAGLLPAAIMWFAKRHESRMVALLDRLWPPRRAERIPRAVRGALVAIAAIAILLAILTPIFGSVWIRAGSTVLFRNSTVSRPLVAATVLLAVVGLFRLLPLALVAVLILVILPFDAYRNVSAVEISRARYEASPLRDLRACLLSVQADGAPAGVYDHADGTYPWKFPYYLRDAGWRSDEAQDRDKLVQRLFTPGLERPEFVVAGDVDTLRASLGADAQRQLDLMHRIAFDDHHVLLLPGPYGTCHDIHGAGVVATK